MKGELIRGSHRNLVRVELWVKGVSNLVCPACQEDTIHAILEENWVQCAVCEEVHSRLPDLVESPGSPLYDLCDCGAELNTPISPATGLPMAHHCECRAVRVSEFLRQGKTRTLHARACSPTPDRVHP